jgi:hypothetical protein
VGMGFAAYQSGGSLPVNAQIPIFMIVYLMAGAVFTSFTFAGLGSKRKAIPILTLPASHFEKLLVGWLYSFVFYQLLIIPAFYLVVLSIHKLGEMSPIKHNDELMNLFGEELILYIVLYFYAALHALCFWGSAFFNKHHYIKTALLLFTVIGLFSWLNTEFLQLFIGDAVQQGTPFGDMNIEENGMYTKVHLKDGPPYRYLASYAIAILMWTSTFFRLKEKEV